MYDSLIVRHELRHVTGRIGMTVLDAVVPVGAFATFPTFRIYHVSRGSFVLERMQLQASAFDPLAPVAPLGYFPVPTALPARALPVVANGNGFSNLDNKRRSLQ